MLYSTCDANLLQIISSDNYSTKDLCEKLDEVFINNKMSQTSTIVRRIEIITVDGTRMRGCPRRKWEDSVRLNLKELALTDDMPLYRKL